MSYFGLDKDFNIVTHLAPYNVQWNRRYYETGDFEIYIDIGQYSSDIKYIYSTEDKELGIVEIPHYSVSNNTKQMLLKGSFFEKILADDCIYPTFSSSGKIVDVVKKLLDKYCSWKMGYRYDESITDRVDFQETGENLDKKLYELLYPLELSFRIEYDYVSSTFTFVLYRGRDLTQNNTDGNNFVTFSTEFGNIEEPDVMIDSSKYKNYAIICGEGQSEERIYVEYDARMDKNERIKKLFVDARSERMGDDVTLDEYKKVLIQKGIEKLADCQIQENVNFGLNTDSYEYKVDFDLGDKVDVIVADIGLVMTARIRNIFEVIKSGYRTLELEVDNLKIM